MHENDQNENALWSLFKNGDKNAFAEIYKIHIGSLLAYGSKRCADGDLLKDNIQDLFVELWNGREHLANVASPRFYLIRALRYKLIRAEKARWMQTAAGRDSTGDEQDFSRSAASVETEIVEKETSESRAIAIRKALLELSARQQEVLQLRFYHGFSNEQIADMMQLNYQSVSNLIYSSLCRLKKNLRSSPVFGTALLAAFHFIF